MINKKIAVLCGGQSEERDVSLNSGRNVYETLIAQGYNYVQIIDVNRDFFKSICNNSTEIDIAFIMLHGRIGEDGCMQGLLECMGIPYTGSGVMASAICMNKYTSYQLFKGAGIPCPESMPYSPHITLTYPYVIKPVDGGSSLGIKIIKGPNDDHQNQHKWDTQDRKLMCSHYIAGRELTVGVMAGKAIGILEVENAGELFGYDSKYNQNSSTRYVCPAQLPTDIEQKVLSYAESAYRITDCRGACRVDFRYDGSEAYILEINTAPGMTDTSMLPIIAESTGPGFANLLQQILESARLHNI